MGKGKAIWFVFMAGSVTVTPIKAAILTPTQQQAIEEQLAIQRTSSGESVNSFSGGGSTTSAGVEQVSPFAAVQNQVFQGSAKAITGFDANPLTLHDTGRLSSAFVDTTGSLSMLLLHSSHFDPAMGYDQSLTGSYALEGIEYEGQLASADRMRMTGDLLYIGRFIDNRLKISTDAKFTTTYLDEHLTLVQPEVNPVVQYFPAHWVALQEGYDYSNLEFRKPPLSDSQRQSAGKHTVGPTLLIFGSDQVHPKKGFDNPWFPSWFDDISLSYFHTFNEARGLDYDYGGDRVRIAIDNIHFDNFVDVRIYQLFKGTTVSLAYQKDFNAYSHANSQLKFGAKRNDNIDSVSISVKHSISPHLAVSFEYDYTGSVSNLTSRSFSDHVFNLGGLLSY